MKQYITLGEMKSHLSPSGDHYINQLIEDGYVDGGIFTIGKMFEFLEEHKQLRKSHTEPNMIREIGLTTVSWTHKSKINSHDICDNLWESVKEILNRI